jgi:hypothetical protein
LHLETHVIMNYHNERQSSLFSLFMIGIVKSF